MTAPYYTLLTNIGAAKLANATATDTPLNITQMGVGDANGTVPTPDPRQTSLIHECRRADLNTLKTDPNNPNQIIAEQVIPDNVGGWYIRELGLYDADGDLIAVGNCPPSYKPLIEEGASREQVIRMILIVTSDDAVTLKIDPAVVLATREYVDDSIEAHAKSRNHPDATTKAKGFVQLSSETNSDDETKAATPKALKAVKATADAAVKTITTGDNTHHPDENGNINLGTAADADITTSTTDRSAGRVLKVGDFGEGVAITIGITTDLNTLTVPGRYKQASTSVDWDGLHYPAHLAGGLVVIDDAGYSDGCTQLYFPWRSSQIFYRNFSGTGSSYAWGEWGAFFSTLNPPTAAQSGAMPYFGTALSVDLNTLGDISAAGVYYQPANAGATAAFHYPVSEAGSLLITPSAHGCQQEYTSFATRRKFLRGLSGVWNGTNGPWSEWVELYSPQYPGEIYGTSANNFRIAYGGYGVFWRNDGIHLYLMLTNKGDPLGNYNSLRPFWLDLVTGDPVMSRLSLTDYTNFDARYNTKYPTGHRIGARTKISGLNSVGDWSSRIPQGAINIASMTMGDDRITDAYYAYPQYLINGNWVNFA